MYQRVALLPIAVACLVAAGCSTTSAQAVPPVAAPAPISTMVAAPADADLLFADLIAFVEETRGVTFEEPPTLRIVGPGGAAFEEQYADDEWLRIDESRYQALGILSQDAPSDPCLADGSGCDAVGSYDPATDEMVVSSAETDWGPAVRAVIVHELTHAVQERRGDLNRLDKIWWRDYEAADAYEALIEGEATLVESQYLDSLPPRGRWLHWEGAADLGTLDPGEATPYFDYVAYYPYDEGTRAVTAAYHAGGWDTVDALLADPPATTEALEYPEAAASLHEELIEMPVLAVEGFEVVEAERWGKNDFDGYLLHALPSNEPTGWADDWYEVHWDGTNAVTVHLLRGDDAAATDRLAEALLRHCRATGLGDGFALLENDSDVAFVASLDPGVTTDYRGLLVELGFTASGSC